MKLNHTVYTKSTLEYLDWEYIKIVLYFQFTV